MRSLIPFSLLLTFFDTSVNAITFPFHGRTLIESVSTLTRRANITTTTGGTPIKNILNTIYVTNITVGDVTIPVLLDTGSSDLWANFPGTAPTAQDLGKSVSLSYVVGQATGNIHTATVQLGNYTVNDQAFLLVTNTSTFSTNIQSQGYDGLIGLGPNVGSNIQNKVDSSAGDNFFTRIFEQNSTSANYVSILLDRQGDPTPTFTGQLTISEPVPGFENITSMPKLSVETVHKVLDSDQHWQVLTDKDDAIIGPDGQVIPYKSIVPSAPDGQLVAVFDSGYTFSQVSRDVSDAIYGRVNGAIFDSVKQWWTIPCGQPLNLTFKFGGNAYPIHPLDVVNNDFGITDAYGNPTCIGAFQPITSAFSLLGEYDMILGMSFLRNTYTLLDYGKWIKTSTTDQNAPFVQLLSVTNANDAYTDFITARLNGTNPSSNPQYTLLPPSQMQHSPVSEEEKKKQYQEMVLSRWPYIFLGCLVFVTLLVGFCIWKCCCRRGAKYAGCCCRSRVAKKSQNQWANDEHQVRWSQADNHDPVDGKGYPLGENDSTMYLNEYSEPHPSPYGNYGESGYGFAGQGHHPSA